MEFKLTKKNLIGFMIAILILLFISVSYIAIDKLADLRFQKNNGYYSAGYMDGQQSAVMTILNTVQKEGYVQLTIPLGNNQTGTLTLVPYVPSEN